MRPAGADRRSVRREFRLEHAGAAVSLDENNREAFVGGPLDVVTRRAGVGVDEGGAFGIGRTTFNREIDPIGLI
jgi:hypothetical protein